MTDWAYRNLRSFKAESGFPYSAYAMTVSTVYGTWMKLIHRFGGHRMTDGPPEFRRCSWCGFPFR